MDIQFLPTIARRPSSLASSVLANHRQQILRPIAAGKQHNNNKSCVICGRNANYKHFQVFSCEGCGFFFKRSIIKRQFFICQKEGNCTMKEITACRACRFDSCVLAGMRVEAMQLPANFNLESAKRRVEVRKQILVSNGRTLIDGRAIQFPAWFCPPNGHSRIVDELSRTDACFRRIRESCTEFNLEPYFGKNLAELFASSTSSADNLLSKAEYFSEMPPAYFDVSLIENADRVEGTGSFDCKNAKYLLKDLLFMIELSKTMPVFVQLELDDKVALLSHVSMPAMVLSASVYSLEKNYKTFLYPDQSIPFNLHRLAWLEESILVQKLDALRKHIFIDALMPLDEMALSKEEFLLLRALLFSHITTPNLSAAGQRLLLMEAEKYTKALLGLCQKRLGEANGAKRFAEVMILMEVIFRTSQRHREYITLMFFPIIDNRPLPGSKRTLDQGLFGECVRGCLKLPELQELFD